MFLSYEDYAKNAKAIDALKKLPAHMLPYMMESQKGKQLGMVAPYGIGPSGGGGGGGFWLGLSNITGSAWDGIKSLGLGAWDGLEWSGDKITDFGSWATGWGSSANSAISKGTSEAASGGGPPQAMTSEQAAQIASEGSSGWWDTVESIGSKAWSGVTDLVTNVGVPAASMYLKYDMAKNSAKQKRQQQGKSGEPSRREVEQAAQNDQEMKKIKDQTAAYVQNHKEKIQQMGYGRNEAIVAILQATGGKPPSPGAPVNKYLSPKSGAGTGAGAGGGIIPSFEVGGMNIGQLIQQYWYLPVGGIVLLLLMRGQR